MADKFYAPTPSSSTIDLSGNPPSAGQFGVAVSLGDSTSTTGVGPGTGWTQRGTWQYNTADAQSLAVWTKDTAWAGGETSLGMTTTSVNLSFAAALDGIDIAGGPLDIAVIQVNDNTAVASVGTIGSGSFTPATNGARILAVMGADTTANVDASFSFTDNLGSPLSWSTVADQNDGFRNLGIGLATMPSAAAITVTGSATYASGNAGRSMFVLVLKPTATGTPVGRANETDTALALTSPGPAISSTSTATPAYGSTLTISGTDFGASQGTKEVRIGGVVQPISSWGDTSIIVSSVVRGSNKYGVALNVEIWDTGLLKSNSFALTGLVPQSGWSYVDLSTPNAAVGNRIATTPDLASGDQVAYSTKGGLVSVANDATFSAGSSVTSFDFEVWSSPDGWGFAATQYIVTTQSAPLSQYAARVQAFSRRRGASLHLLNPANWGAVPLGVEKWFAQELTAAAGGASGSVGLASETDTALPRGSARPAGLATETDSALALAGTQLRAVGTALETDAALAVTALQIKAAGLASETDSALALAGVQLKATGLASETDLALALSANIGSSAGRADEADLSLAPSGAQLRAVGMAAETDAALALAGLQLRATGLASETDAALALARLQITAAGLASEVDTALHLFAAGAQPPGIATETDLAFALTGSQSQIVIPQTSFSEFSGAVVKSKPEPKQPRVRAPKQRAARQKAVEIKPPVLASVGMAIETCEALALVGYIVDGGLMRSTPKPQRGPIEDRVRFLEREVSTLRRALNGSRGT